MPRPKPAPYAKRAAATIPNSGGKRKFFTGHGTTERRALADAQRQAAEWLAGYQAGRVDSTITVRGYLEVWLRDRAPMRGQAQTVEMHRQSIARLLPAIGNIRLTELDPPTLQRALTALVRKGRAPRTVNLSRSSLSTMLTDARRDRLITSNPVEDTTPARNDRGPTEPFTAEEAARLLAWSQREQHQDWPIYACLLTYGLRIGEVLGLRWQDVDSTAGTLSVAGKVHRLGKGTPQLSDKTKTPQSRRTLPLMPLVTDALAWRRERTDSPTLIFTGERGQPLSDNTVRKRLYRTLARYGLPRRKPHASRHAVVTLLIQQGADAATVAAIVGHSSTHVTTRVYLHTDAEQIRKGLERLSQTLSGANNGATVALTVAPTSQPTPETARFEYESAAN